MELNSEINLKEKKMKSENIILYDYLAFTSKIHNITYIKKLLGIEGLQFEEIYGFYGYHNRLYNDGISIHYNGNENMGILVEMTGQGCRNFETNGNGDYESIFRDIIEEKESMNITRLDVAFDDHTGVFNIKKLLKESQSGNFVSKFDVSEAIFPFKKDTGITISHGSQKSNIYIRIYDKAKERQCSPDTHWIRFELQLRSNNAFGFINNSLPVTEKYLGVINNYLRYVKPDSTDNNKWRWENAPFWNKFIGEASKVKIYTKPGVEYNELKLYSYVIGQAGNSINTMREIHGDDYFINSLNEHKKTAVLSEKHKRLISKHKSKQPIVEKNSEDIENKYAKGYLEVKDKDFNQTEPIFDSYNKRWYKCDLCGKIDVVAAFWLMDGNHGKCISCQKKSKSVIKSEKRELTEEEKKELRKALEKLRDIRRRKKSIESK